MYKGINIEFRRSGRMAGLTQIKIQEFLRVPGSGSGYGYGSKGNG